VNELSCSHQADYVDFSDLAAEVSISLPEVSETIINASIYRATTELLEARVYRQTISLDYEKGVNSYPIESAECTSVLSISDVMFDDYEVHDYKLDADKWLILPDRLLGNCSGTSLTLLAALTLTRGSCKLPLEVYERFGRTIINITLSTLYGMYGEAWYDSANVRFYGGLGQQGIAKAKAAVLQDEVGDSIPMRPIRMIL
jgi:hypothetical protein